MGRRFSRMDAPPPYGLTKMKPPRNSGTEASRELAMILKSGRTRRSTGRQNRGFQKSKRLVGRDHGGSRGRNAGQVERTSPGKSHPTFSANVRRRRGRAFRDRRIAACRPGGPPAGTSGWQAQPEKGRRLRGLLNRAPKSMGTRLMKMNGRLGVSQFAGWTGLHILFRIRCPADSHSKARA